MTFGMAFNETAKGLKNLAIDKIEKVISDNDGFIAFPTSDEEEENKVRVHAHVDMSGNMELCVVGSLLKKVDGVVANLSDNFCGQWELGLAELSIESLGEILTYLELEGYIR